MQTLAATALSLGVLAAIALSAGGLFLVGKSRNRNQGILMLIAAAVLLANVLIWSL